MSASSRGLTAGQVLMFLVLTPLLILGIASSYGLLGYRTYLDWQAARTPEAGCTEKYIYGGLSDQELAKILEAHAAFLRSSSADPNHSPTQPVGQLANLCGADLDDRNLSHAVLSGANLSEASLNRANLTGATLMGLDAMGIHGSGTPDTNLRHAWLSAAKLNDADLEGADLRWARFGDDPLRQGKTDLTGTQLAYANLDGVIFDVKLESIPKIIGISEARNLQGMTYAQSPDSLEALRKVFKESGLTRQEKEITYALQHTRRLQEGPTERIFNLILFELPCAWGLHPGRTLEILVSFWVLFSFSYMFALRAKGSGAIWAVWADDRIGDAGESCPVRVTKDFPFGMSPRLIDRIAGFMRVVFVGFYFSLISASQIGWHDLNLGNWISRIQPREFNLRATGWVRVLSGIQSLLSVYLLALWVLTYFGNPFE